AAAITRRHFVVDHGRDGIEGLASLVGGKLTTYCSLAQGAVSWVWTASGRPNLLIRGGSWRAYPMTGSSVEALAKSFESFGVEAEVSRRLARVYGPAGAELLELCRLQPELARPVADGEPVLAAEV